MGLPYPGSPLVLLPPPFLHQMNLSRPHPSGRGGADVAGSAFPSELRGLNLSPHPSKERRGSIPVCRVWLKVKWVATAMVVVVGWVEDEWMSTIIRKNTISKSATQVQLRCHFGQPRQLSCLAHPGELEVKVPLVAQS